MAPLAWSADALYWVAQDGPDLALQRIPLAAALPQRLGSVPVGTIAVRVLDQQTIRLLVRDDGGALSMRTWPSDEPLFTLDTAPPGTSGGLWRGEALLLAGDTELRELTFSSEALR
jgi:hypothetical protein